MNATVQATLSHLKLGEPQAFHNFTLFPILDGEVAGPEYLTLGEALKRESLKISEMDEAGSVPEVKVTNLAELAVLLLDGEELLGAKQNRVLNTTILLRPQCETVVNVSCTERGRWHYDTPEFRDSEVVMARNIRARKSRSVSENLRSSREFRSDQGEVWEQIDELAASSGVESRTGAMRDVYTSKEQQIQESLEAFPRVDGQRGVVFLVGESVIGMDLVSRADAYIDLHDKLVKSYVIDSPLERCGVDAATSPPTPASGSAPTPPSKGDQGGCPPAAEVVERFLKQLAACSETSFDSVGCGTDYRYDAAQVCGSALVHEDTCIHAAFFANEHNAPQEDQPNMQGFRQRRQFRQ